MNIFTKSLVLVGKIIVAVVLLYFTYLLFLQKDWQGIYFGLALLFFVTLPTIFVVYFKNKFAVKHPKFVKAWKFLRIIYALIIFLFVLFMILVAFRAYQKDKTAKAIEFISSTRITLDDVMGKNLPPEPTKVLNDLTVAGFDVNNNVIRDDVELAIFKKYPNSAKIRSAELQYAQALQLETIKVFDAATLIMTWDKAITAANCIDAIEPATKEEIKNLVFNTDMRLKKQEDDYNKYMTDSIYMNFVTYLMSPTQRKCDIELSSLPN